MSSKTKTDAKVPVLKGQEAEDKVLEYLKRMNRPYGAIDVAANLKGAIPKAAVQKILVALTEKGQLVQKTYGKFYPAVYALNNFSSFAGKTTFFVINQENLDSVPNDALVALETEQKAIDEANKTLVADLRTAQAELVKLKTAPSDQELDSQLAETARTISSLSTRLEPLRSGAPLISEAELGHVDAEWTQWRSEWVKRRKVFTTFWQLATDSLPPQDAANLAEDLGVELDTPEHASLERSNLCAASSNPLKRKR